MAKTWPCAYVCVYTQKKSRLLCVCYLINAHPNLPTPLAHTPHPTPHTCRCHGHGGSAANHITRTHIPCTQCFPTMITPWTDDLTVDWATLDKMIEWYIASGCTGLFAVCQSSEMFFVRPASACAPCDRLLTSKWAYVVYEGSARVCEDPQPRRSRSTPPYAHRLDVARHSKPLQCLLVRRRARRNFNQHHTDGSARRACVISGLYTCYVRGGNLDKSQPLVSHTVGKLCRRSTRLRP